MQLSVILPTVRPHLLRRALSSVPLAARGVEHEVVVVADFAPFEQYLDWVQQGWVTWVTRTRRGVVDAANVGYEASRGERVFLFNDESVLDDGALTLLHEEAERNPWRLLSPRHLPEFPFQYYGRPFVPFVYADRRVIDRLAQSFRGNVGVRRPALLDPIYRGFYADPDLSMHAHESGVPLCVVNRAVLRHHNDHDDAHRAAVGSYLEEDRAAFRARWDHLGTFGDP